MGVKPEVLHQGTCEEEAARLEVFLDTVRARVAGHAEKRDALQRKCAAQRLPWEPHLFADVGANAMHLATLYMSRCGAHRPLPYYFKCVLSLLITVYWCVEACV